jgi:hypothetical protein
MPIFGIVVSLPRGSAHMNKPLPYAVSPTHFGRVQPAHYQPVPISERWRRLAPALLIACAAAAPPLIQRSYAGDAETTSSARSWASQVSRTKTVTVTVTPLNIATAAATWEFKVVLDTHSQDLQDDLLTAAAIVDGAGNEQRPIAWQGSPPGGHHREGLLQFNAPEPRPAMITLRLRRPNETEPRAFTWAAR